MKIRRAAEQDLADLHRLLLQVNLVHHRGRPDLFRAGGAKYTDRQLLDLIRDDTRPVFVAAGNGRVLGYAFCILRQYRDDNIRTELRELYLDDLCVDEAARGGGIGRQLYEHVRSFARQEGCYHVTLNVWSCNPDAVRVYESCGLKPLKIGMEAIL